MKRTREGIQEDLSGATVPARSGEVTALVKPNGRSVYVVSLTEAGLNGQRIVLGDVNKMTRAEAETKAAAMQDELRRAALETGLLADQGGPLSFADFIEEHYLPFVIQKQRSTGSTESYLRNWIVPSLGDKMLDDISDRHILFLLRSLEIAGLKPGSINRVLNILKSCFSKAIEWRLCTLPVSPAAGVSERHDPAKIDRFLTHDEAQKLTEAVQRSRNKMLFPVVGFLLMTGARRSEALNAQWSHIDLNRKIWVVPLSKSGKPRPITLSLKALTFLAQARTTSNAYPAAKMSPYVFPNLKTGKPFENLFNSWDYARKRAGLKDVRMHDLRHSFASALVNNGHSIYDVKELLGHSSVQTTQRYAHLSQERLNGAAESVSEYFSINDTTDNHIRSSILSRKIRFK